jgi:hypothetical protein
MVTSMFEPIVGVSSGGRTEQRPDEFIEMLLGAGCLSPQVAFELAPEYAPEHLDGIEVGRVRGQEEPGATSGFHKLLSLGAFMGAEVIEHHHLPWLEGGKKNLLDEGFKSEAVRGSFQAHHGLDTLRGQRA